MKYIEYKFNIYINILNINFTEFDFSSIACRRINLCYTVQEKLTMTFKQRF